jgi:hypothetical protein
MDWQKRHRSNLGVNPGHKGIYQTPNDLYEWVGRVQQD